MSALVLTPLDDDLWELTYLDDVVGWIEKIQPAGRRVSIYQVETPRGEIRHTYSLRLARNLLLELYS